MAEDGALLSRFDELLGTEWLDDDPDHARVRVSFRPELCQPAGLVHGGVITSLVESICSRATFLAVRDEGMQAMGQSISVSFVRPVTEGAVEVEARASHRGRSTWVWEARATNSEGKLAALAQMTVVVRPMRPAKAA
jgi:uncharacterized protein (TIGR00369 family)